MVDDQIRILIVEDEGAVLQSLFNILNRRYPLVYTAPNAQKALLIFETEEIDLVITDIRMPGMDGLTMLQKMKLKKPDLRRIVMSAYSEAEYFIQSINLGVDGYIVKPFLKDKILDAIEKSAKSLRMEKIAEESKRQLAISEKELRELNETKDKFFSIIGHDIKMPVSTIASFSSLLIDDFEKMDPAEARQIIHIIQKSSIRALDLLKNLLEWAKVQTGSISYKPEIIKVCETLEEEVDIATSHLKKKNIALLYNPNPENFVFADRNMLRTIFRNLLSNAIKYTPEKGTIRLFSERIQQDGEFIKISIEDNGIGIPPQILPNLFTLKENYSSKGTSGEVGTGMGLLFCKEFVDIHGGSIQVESVEGKGSTFSFTLPVREKEESGNLS